MTLNLRRFRLSSQVVLALVAASAVAMGVQFALATRWASETARASSQRWAQAIATAAAAAAAERMDQHDDAGLQSALAGLVAMPGVRRIDALDAQGQARLSVEVDAQRGVRSLWNSSTPTGADDPAWVQAWAPVGPAGRLGNVRVSANPEAETGILAPWRAESVLALGLAGLASLVLVQWLLGIGLRPLRQLIEFARKLDTEAGTEMKLGGSPEVVELGAALNEASQQLRKRLDDGQASDRRTQCIVNAVPDAIIAVNAEGHILSASPAVASIFGHESSRLVGLALSSLLPGLDAEAVEKRTLEGLYMRASRTHVARFEAEALRHGGTTFPVEVSLARVDDGDDEQAAARDSSAMRYICAVRDVTDQRMLDGMLNLYVRALQCSSNGVVISDMSLPGRPVIFANAAFERITGYEPSFAIGRNCSFLQRGDDGQPEIKELEQAMADGRSCTVVLRNYRADGSLFFNELSIAPVQDSDGPPRHYVGILNDVTERERARLAIAERNARLNAVFDLSPDGFVVFDRERQLVYVNHAFLTMTGWDSGVATEGLTLPDFERRMCDLADPAFPYLMLEQPELFGDGFDQMDLLHLSQPRHRVLSRLVRHNAGGQGETILYFRDVTHESEVDRMKSEFLTTAAHELRTPMVSVFGFTELLLQRPVPEARRRDVLETIHRQASLLISMINDLLDLARIESRKGRDLSRERSQAGTLVADTVSRLAGAAAGHELRVSLRPEHCELALWVDPAKTSQALTNVLSNAIKYSSPGSLVQIGSRTHPDHAQCLGLVVRDHGVGMTPEQLARVFERFYRADPSGNIPGTGLGMSLVKEIVEQQGGDIEITSHTGLGTEVTLWLPLAAVVEEQEA